MMFFLSAPRAIFAAEDIVAVEEEPELDDDITGVGASDVTGGGVFASIEKLLSEDNSEEEPSFVEFKAPSYKAEEEAVAAVMKDPSDLNVYTLAIIRARIALSILAEYNSTKSLGPNREQADKLLGALEYSQSAEELLPEDASLPFITAKIYTAFGLNPMTLELADESARRALDLNPDYYEAEMLLGFIKFHRKSFTAAQNHFERAISAKPELLTAELASLLGMSYFLDENAKRGAEFLSGFAAKNADHGPALFALAILQNAEGNKADAVKTMVEAEKHLDVKNAAYAAKLRGDWDSGRQGAN